MKNFLIYCSLTVLLLYSCGAKETRKIITIGLPDVPTDVGVQIINESIDKFQQIHPDIKIKKYLATWREYQSKMLTMIAGGTPPDIFRVAPDWIPEFVMKDALLPLDDYVKQSELVKLDDFFPQLIFKYRFDERKIVGKGPIYGFGTDWSPDYILIFNKDMFDRQGLAYPNKSMSWQEFVTIATKLTKRDKQNRIVQFGCYFSDVRMFVYQNGGRVFTEDGKKCLMNTKEAVEGIQFFMNLVLKHKVSPTLSQQEGQDIDTIFKTGKLAMFVGGRYWVANLIRQIKDFKWGVAPNLHGKKRINTTESPYGWVISKNAKYPRETWMLMEYFIGGEGEVKLAEVGYNIPVLKSVAYSEAFLYNKNYEVHPKGLNKVFLDEAKYTIPTEVSAYIPAARVNEIISVEIEKTLLEQQTPAECGGNIAGRINKEIQQALDAL